MKDVNWRRVRRRGAWALVALAVLLGLLVHVPELLLFPYHERIGDTDVYAEEPIPPQMEQVLARADGLLRTSGIYGPGYGRRIFLTSGGLRWHLLALTSSGSFGLTRPLSEAVIVNAHDVGRDLVTNGREVGGERPLSAVIAHERTHGLIRAHFGIGADWSYPAWLREGYCDYVAGGGSLSDQQAQALEHSGEDHPALVYYHGRKRVEEMLRANGGSVDALFAAAD